jgi:regulator of protease activity HflC (stomatin/prohibitin superfamily)
VLPKWVRIRKEGDVAAVPAAALGRWAAVGLGGLAVLVAVNMAVYTVEEGNVGIVKRFGQAVEAVDPGLHFKMPLVDAVELIEVPAKR